MLVCTFDLIPFIIPTYFFFSPKKLQINSEGRGNYFDSRYSLIHLYSTKITISFVLLIAYSNRDETDIFCFYSTQVRLSQHCWRGKSFKQQATFSSTTTTVEKDSNTAHFQNNSSLKVIQDIAILTLTVLHVDFISLLKHLLVFYLWDFLKLCY